MTPEPPLQLDDLLAMSQAERWAVMMRAHPIPSGSLDDTRYLGVDLSLPELANRLLWKTFEKTFHRDTRTGELRGWNVRVEQRGCEEPTRALRDRQGRAKTFGHYRLRSARGVRFPFGWEGADTLDYRRAGNAPLDPARLGYCPLVAVNEGDAELLLGWEVFKVGRLWLPLPDFWALRRQGPLTELVDPHRLW